MISVPVGEIAKAQCYTWTCLTQHKWPMRERARVSITRLPGLTLFLKGALLSLTDSGFNLAIPEKKDNGEYIL